MNWRKLGRQFNFLLHYSRRTQRLDDDIEAHFDQRVEQKLRQGLAPREARIATRREFGSVLRAREQSREVWGFRWLDELLQDTRFGLRLLAHAPLFTAVVVLSLALGIGANSALFSIINALMLRKLPVPAPEQLVQPLIRSRVDASITWNYPIFEQFRDRASAFSDIVAFTGGEWRAWFNVKGQAAEPDFVTTQDVSGNFWSLLGVPAALGRTFTLADDQLSDPHDVAVISYSFWKTRFALDPGVIGRNFILHNTPFSIIGVAPPGFNGITPEEHPQLWIPITTRKHLFPNANSMFSGPRAFWFQIIARVRPSVSREQARAQLDATYQIQNREQLAKYRSELTATQIGDAESNHVELRSASTGFSWKRETYGHSLLVLLLIAAFVLLIACVNVASLMLARSVQRQREMAVRLSIGAGRWRLGRQLLTESLLLSLAAGLLSVVFAVRGSRALLSFASSDEPLQLNLQPDIRMFLFVVGLSLLTGIVFGVAPALRATRIHAIPVLKSGGGTVTRDKTRLMLDKILIVAQVALALLLVATAGLFVRTVENLRHRDTGFDRDHLLVFGLDLGPGYNNQIAQWKLYHRISNDVQSLPGTVATGYASPSYLGGSSWGENIVPDGYVRGPDEDVASYGMAIGPKFVEAAGLRLLSGREFGPQDQPSGPLPEPKEDQPARTPAVAIVNEKFARYFFGNSNPLGRYLQFADSYPGAPQGRIQVVGVVNDTVYQDLHDPKHRIFYFPAFSTTAGVEDVSYFVRTYGNPDAITSSVRKLLHDIDPAIKPRLTTMRQVIDDQTRQERILATLSSLLSGFALALVSLGLYGITAFSVTSRVGEIGIRMTLGARAGQVLRMILRETGQLVTIGVVCGVPLALTLTTFLKKQLYGVEPRDPATLVTAALVMIAVALAAASIPARRAAHIDPMTALKYE